MSNQWLSELQRLIPGVRQIHRMNGIALEIPCATHGPVLVTFDKKLPAQIIRKKLTERGWTIGKKHHCPTDAQEKKDQKSMTTEPTPDAKRVHRAVMEALMCAYDEDRRTYSSGYSDQRIATETGAAIEYVRKTREDYFGPVAEPSELTDFRERLDAFEQQIGKFDTDHTAVSQQLKNSVADLRADLARLARANGWS